MDRVLFKTHLDGCTFVPEEVSSLECRVWDENSPVVFNQKTRLSDKALKDFISQPGHQSVIEDHNGRSSTPKLRLVLQDEVKHPDTFEPTNLSLRREVYETMVDAMHLPCNWLETSSCVGPFFWWNETEIDGAPYFQIVYRKSDVKKARDEHGRNKDTRGWELVLSYDINRGMTSGYYRGTLSAGVAQILKLLQECGSNIGHPLLLPILICSLDFNVEGDKRHRNAREKVRELEKEITEAAEIYTDRDFTKQDNVNLGKLNKELVECHCKVLWKRPEAYLNIIQSMQQSMSKIQDIWAHTDTNDLSADHSMLEDRLGFLSMKLHGIITYRQVTIARLDMLQGLVQNLVSLKIARNEQEVINKKMERADTFREEQKVAKKQKQINILQKELDNELEGRKQIIIGYVSVFFIPGAFIAVSPPTPHRR